jgi:hypothetical protein
MTMSSSRSIQLAIPRARAEAELGAVEALHGRVIHREQATKLEAALVELRDSIGTASAEDAPRLAQTLLELLAAAVRA